MPLVFATGRPLAGATVVHALHRHCARAGIARARFHDLRHVAASTMLARGVPMRIIQDVLGHSAISTTADVYTHLAPADRTAADAMVGAYGRPVVVSVVVNGPDSTRGRA